ncbi:ribonuclease III, partial [Cryphonectria parasitica EP155]
PEVPILTPWTPSDVSPQLPPVPRILDPSLELASFTHAGAVKNHDDRSYEQLEWLGDAYLYLMSTAYIFLTFPNLKHGDMCHIREVLVRNATLKDYSLHYGFDKRAVVPDEYGLDGRQGGTKASSKERAKVLGDVFEAHVAAIILSDPIRGVSRTASWLKALWSTTISEQIKKNNGSAKDRLSGELALREPRVQIEYRSLDEGRQQKRDPLTNMKLFTQGSFLVGYGETVQLGIGTAKKKSEANEKAAQNALENKKLMNTYREKKRVMQENKRAAQEGAS